MACFFYFDGTFQMIYSGLVLLYNAGLRPYRYRSLDYAMLSIFQPISQATRLMRDWLYTGVAGGAHVTVISLFP